jgi:glycosyltransferase involved in cell wall biosynthesis
LVFRRADVLVAECRRATESASALKGPGTKVIALRHPVDPPAPGQRSREEARRGLGLDPDRPLLLFFGYVRKYKGLDVLLEAMPVVVRHSKAILVVAGEIWSGRRSILARIRRGGVESDVRLWDRYASVGETELLFTACDLVILPYLDASGSGVFSLAAQYRRPVVASAVGPFGELVKDGVTGRLVRPGNPGLLASAIIESLEPAVLARYAQAVRDSQGNISWENYADRLLAELGLGVTA